MRWHPKGVRLDMRGVGECACVCMRACVSASVREGVSLRVRASACTGTAAHPGLISTAWMDSDGMRTSILHASRMRDASILHASRMRDASI
eukprot:6172530-Pleurochrysis_carterae.AAC.1